ncbi:hypothetical protein ANCCAN_27844 [Ancylostoma caninum]|uniref:Uncharacterized protein n=1 Tax=Ancylostoma caninum TaxID=29170 RepID=A0A368F5Y1_ANCCA|nr:hypothetical protein ANCCAN_27844 [Ancylostoma caninum]
MRMTTRQSESTGIWFLRSMPTQVCFSEAIANPTIRKGIFLGMVVSASQIFSGSMASISYSTRYGCASLPADSLKRLLHPKSKPVLSIPACSLLSRSPKV